MVPLEEHSYSPGPLKGARDPFKTLLRSTESKDDSCYVAVLIHGPLPHPLAALMCPCRPVALFFFVPSLFRMCVCVFWDASPAPFSTCCENISSGMFLDGPLLMGSCLANNKALELSSTSAAP